MPEAERHTDDVPLAAEIAQLIEEFALLAPGDRLQALVEAGADVPELPEHVVTRRDQMEPVRECQAPVFLLVDLVPSSLGEGAEPLVQVYVDAPAHAPTTRGYAGLLSQALSGRPASQALALPPDLPQRLGLAEVVSPLRLNGMIGLGRRVRRQVSRGLGQDAAEA